MATHNPKESRPTCESTLNYMYRGENHEHVIDQIIHLGGNLLSKTPIHKTGSNVSIDLNEIIAEFNYQASRHKGKAEDLFKHYVISLAPGETLEAFEWLEFITSYMEKLGFNNSTKWTAVEHRDTNACHHVHILACRIKSDKFGSLVSTYNDYEKGWSVMREYERKFGLQLLENPDQNFGINKSKGYIKLCQQNPNHLSRDESVAIRRAFKKLYEYFGKPKTMKDLALGLSRCGVELSVATDKSNAITGINYRLKSGRGRWISGSKIKATRFTWGALQKKEGISYDPNRDDAFLRREDGIIEIHINFKDTQKFYALKMVTEEYHQHRRLLLARFRTKQLTDAESLMALIQAILIFFSILFGIPIAIDDCEFSVNRFDEATPSPWVDGDVLDSNFYTMNQLFDGVDAEVLRSSEWWVNPQLFDIDSEYSKITLLDSSYLLGRNGSESLGAFFE